VKESDRSKFILLFIYLLPDSVTETGNISFSRTIWQAYLLGR